MRALLLAATLAFVLPSSAAPPGPPDPFDEAGFGDVAMRDLFRGYVGSPSLAGLTVDGLAGRAPLYAVVSDQATLDLLYQTHLARTAPAVDFAQETVYVAVAGHRNQDCGFHVSEVRSSPGTGHAVRVFGATPYTGALLCYDVVNARAHVVAVPLHDGAVTFHDHLSHAVVGAGAA